MNLTRAVDLLSLNRPSALAKMLDEVMTTRLQVEATNNKPLRDLYRRWSLRAERRVAKYANTVIWAAAVDPITLRAYQHGAMATIDREGAKVAKRIKRENDAKASAAVQS